MEQPTNEFDKKIGRLIKSAAYLDYCRELTGYEIYLFNMMDKEQLDFIFDSIPISSGDMVLDIGCGSGCILNKLCKRKGCSGVGVDILPRGLTTLNNENTRYLNAGIDDIGDFDLKPTLTLSVDSLYFSSDPEKPLKSLCAMENNRIYLFYSQYIFDDSAEDKSILGADSTRVARILKKIGVPYQTVDYSENERRLYEKSIPALEKRCDAFKGEGNADLYEEKLQEQLYGKRLYEAGNASRYLYIIA